MARDKLFISFSHKDQALFDQVMVNLKPWKRQGRLIWTDANIEADSDWHQSIQTALAESAVAMLLVSPDFLNSDYIADSELPVLLKAREQDEISLGILYLRPSLVDSVEFPITLDSGEVRTVKLTKYQGLNQPDRPVAGLSDPERDQVLVDAVIKLEGLFKKRAQATAPAPSGGVGTPTVTHAPTGGASSFTGSGQQKLEFSRRLGSSWQDLADIVGIESFERAAFGKGDEAREIWTWLQNRNRLQELPARLREIGRDDIFG